MTIAAMKNISSVAGLALSLLMGTSASVPALADTAATVPESETADVMKIDPPKPEWFYVRGGWNTGGTSIFDAKSGKMKGTVNTSRNSDMAIDPAGQFYYVSETIWSKGNRGTRQDMVSVYDATEMKLVTEIKIPDRIIIGSRKQNFIVSDDGKMGFIYNLSPASSVNVVDLVKRKFVKTIELPGCAALMPNTAVGFSALCSDGSMATVDVSAAKPAITHTAPFFSATADPIFENFTYDKAKKQAVMLSYTGQIYTASISASPSVSQPFSIQVAAGYSAGYTKPLDLAWYPGGRQPMALHRPSGHLFVLMHMGEYWSHKQDATEIWDVDLAKQKVVKRFPLAKPAGHIEVTQDAEPRIWVNGDEGGGVIIDVKTGEEKYKIDHAGGGVITVTDPS